MTTEQEERFKRDLDHSRQTLELIGAVMPFWPHAREHKRRDGIDGRRISAQRVPMEKRHRWFRGPTKWHCNVCRAYAKGTGPAQIQLPGNREREACPGLADALAPDEARERGHRIVQFQTTEGPFTICGDCGCWAISVQKASSNHACATCSPAVELRSGEKCFATGDTLILENRSPTSLRSRTNLDVSSCAEY
jgi:hypothetical protein